MAGILIALVSGALMSIQGVFNTEVTKQSSIWVAAGWVQLSALAVCAAAWFFTGRESIGALWGVDHKYTPAGRRDGAFITITVIKGWDALGPARATMLIVIAQLAVSYLVELMGAFGVEKQPFEWRKLVGLAVSAAGIVLFKWK